MAVLKINDDDLSAKLKDFSFRCLHCMGTNVTLDIDWTSYPSASWHTVTVICGDCHQDETIYDS